MKHQSEGPKIAMTMTDNYPKVYLYRRIVQAKIFIDGNYADKIDLDNISDEAYFSKFHFIRLFKSIYRKTPHQYLKYVRIEKAKHLLKNNTSVSEVCFLVGFESVSSFSGLFSKVVGESPSAYGKRFQEMKEKINKAPHAFLPGCYSYQHGWLENSNFGEVTT
ncbi:MAG: AraC family transcriptional regulator [Chryseolinea sp.]